MKSIKWLAKIAIEAAAEGDKVPTFSLVAYTGGALVLPNFPAPLYIDLAGAEFHSSIIANFHHDKRRPVGTVTQATIDGATVNMSGLLNHAGSDREQILASSKMGFAYEASIEAKPHELEQLDDGETSQVNGKTVSGPAIIARKSTVYGVAFVPQGADDNTRVTIAASAAHTRGSDMEFEKWLETIGVNLDELNDDGKAEIRAAFDAKFPAKPTKKGKSGGTATAEPVDDWSADDIRAAYDASRDQLDEVALELDGEYDAKAIKAALSTARKSITEAKGKAVREKWSADRFGRECDNVINAAKLTVVRESRPTGPAIHSSASDMGADVIEAALCQSVRMPEDRLAKSFDAKTLEAAHKTFRGRLGLQQLIIEAANAGGANIRPGERLTTGNLRNALRCAFGDIHASSGFASVGLSGILSNVANKELLMGYEEVDANWREIADIKSVTDFKQMTSYRLLDSMEYEELAPDGRIKHGTIDEESYTRQAKTFAKMLAITRTDIINDDLGAFDDLRTRLGRGAAKKLSSLFWTKFLDNSTFFTTARTNYITGATTTLLTDGVGLALGVKAFRQMTSPTGDGSKRVGLGMRPTKLIVPPELEPAARALFVANNIANVKGSEANIYAGLYRPIVVNQLSETGTFTGASATAWYLFGDEMNPMAVSFLNGQQSPTVESSDVDFDMLGIQFRGYHDFGCDKSEYLSGVKSKGAA